MAVNNRDRVGRALDAHLGPAMGVWVDRRMTKRSLAGGNWKAAYAGQNVDSGPSALIAIVFDSYQDVFKAEIGSKGRSLLDLVRSARNDYAHNQPFSVDAAYKALDRIEEFLVLIDAPEASEVGASKTELMRQKLEAEARRATPKPEAMFTEPAAGLRPWREVAQPHDDVAQGRYDVAEFAANLAQVAAGKGLAEYKDPDGQRVLTQLRVGIVGAGGTGSAVFEQLVRIGVGQILIIDPDTINDDGSNVTRVYGSTMADVGKAKVDLAKRNADQIGFGTRVTAVTGTINDLATAQLLTTCDVIFGCTDDNRGRVTLARIATWYLIPVIDMGVKLTSTDSTLRGIEGRITSIGPFAGCLQCRGRISAAALQTEVFNPIERGRRIEEGYAQGLDDRDPAVIAFTTGVAAHAVSELLHRIFALDDSPSGELIIRFHRRDIRRNTRSGRPEHWCTDPNNVGSGDTAPFVGTLWTS